MIHGTPADGFNPPSEKVSLVSSSSFETSTGVAMAAGESESGLESGPSTFDNRTTEDETLAEETELGDVGPAVAVADVDSRPAGDREVFCASFTAGWIVIYFSRYGKTLP